MRLKLSSAPLISKFGKGILFSTLSDFLDWLIDWLTDWFVLIYKPGETIQCTALFSHGTQVAMFSRKCRAGIFISKTVAWGGIPGEITWSKKHKDCYPIKECGKKLAQKENYKNQKTKPSLPMTLAHSLYWPKPLGVLTYLAERGCAALMGRLFTRNP